MSEYALLNPVLKDVLKAITPLQEDWVIRFQIINDLQGVVQSLENLRGASVEPFGSFVSNLFTRWGDLDISIELPNRTCISTVAKKHKQVLLGDLLRALRTTGWWHNFHFIPNARVPILKFKSNHQGISCDISIDNLQGQMKSKLLLLINNMDDRFRDMILLVKEWAKAHDINNSKMGTFNSYSLSLLVIFHFQTCAPAILPPLKDLYPGNMVDDLKGHAGARSDAVKHISEIFDANINRFRSDKCRPLNRSSLSELFFSFLAKFSDISSKAAELGICAYTGQWEEIRSNMRWLPKTCAIFVEDPFEQPENTARGVSIRQLRRISEVFDMTHLRLVSGKLNRSSLLDELAQPHTLKRMGFVPFNNSWYTKGCYQMQQSQRKVLEDKPSASKKHSQPQKVNPEKQHHKGAIKGPVQQTWRVRSGT